MKIQPYLHLLLSSGMTAALLYLVFAELSIAEFFSILRGTDRKLFLTYIFLSFVGLAARAYRTKLILSETREKPVQLSLLFLVTAARNAFVDLLPARLGEVSYVYLLKRLQVSVATGVGSLVLAIVLDLLVLSFLLLGFVLSPLVLRTGAQHLESSHWLIPLALFLVSLLLFVTLRLNGLIKSCSSVIFYGLRFLRGERAARLKARAIEFSNSVSESVQGVRSKAVLLKLVGLTIVLRVAKYGGLLALLFAVVGQWEVSMSQIDESVAVIAFVSAEASASLPISGLMGFGVYEGVWSLVFSSACSGVSCESVPTAALALAIHMLTQMVGYSLGICSMFALLVVINRRENGLTN